MASSEQCDIGRSSGRSYIRGVGLNKAALPSDLGPPALGSTEALDGDPNAGSTAIGEDSYEMSSHHSLFSTHDYHSGNQTHKHNIENRERDCDDQHEFDQRSEDEEDTRMAVPQTFEHKLASTDVSLMACNRAALPHNAKTFRLPSSNECPNRNSIDTRSPSLPSLGPADVSNEGVESRIRETKTRDPNGRSSPAEVGASHPAEMGPLEPRYSWDGSRSHEANGQQAQVLPQRNARLVIRDSQSNMKHAELGLYNSRLRHALRHDPKGYQPPFHYPIVPVYGRMKRPMALRVQSEELCSYKWAELPGVAVNPTETHHGGGQALNGNASIHETDVIAPANQAVENVGFTKEVESERAHTKHQEAQHEMQDAHRTNQVLRERVRVVEDRNKSLDATILDQRKKIKELVTKVSKFKTFVDGLGNDIDAIKRGAKAERQRREQMSSELQHHHESRAALLQEISERIKTNDHLKDEILKLQTETNSALESASVQAHDLERQLEAKTALLAEQGTLCSQMQDQIDQLSQAGRHGIFEEAFLKHLMSSKEAIIDELCLIQAAGEKDRKMAETSDLIDTIAMKFQALSDQQSASAGDVAAARVAIDTLSRSIENTLERNHQSEKQTEASQAWFKPYLDEGLERLQCELRRSEQYSTLAADSRERVAVLQEQLRASTAQRDESNADLCAVRLSESQLRMENISLQLRLEALEKEVTSGQNDRLLAEMDTKLQTMKSDLDDKVQVLSEITATNSDLQQHIDALEMRLSETQSRVPDLDTEHENLERAVREKLEIEKSKFAEQAMTFHAEEKFKASNEIKRLAREREKLQQVIKEQEAQLEKLEASQQASQMVAQTGSMEDYAVISAESATQEAQIQDLVQDRQNIQTRLDGVLHDIETLHGQLQQAEQTISDLQAWKKTSEDAFRASMLEEDAKTKRQIDALQQQYVQAEADKERCEKENKDFCSDIERSWQQEQASHAEDLREANGRAANAEAARVDALVRIEQLQKELEMLETVTKVDGPAALVVDTTQLDPDARDMYVKAVEAERDRAFVERQALHDELQGYRILVGSRTPRDALVSSSPLARLSGQVDQRHNGTPSNLDSNISNPLAETPMYKMPLRPQKPDRGSEFSLSNGDIPVCAGFTLPASVSAFNTKYTSKQLHDLEVIIMNDSGDATEMPRPSSQNFSVHRDTDVQLQPNDQNRSQAVSDQPSFKRPNPQPNSGSKLIRSSSGMSQTSSQLGKPHRIPAALHPSRSGMDTAEQQVMTGHPSVVTCTASNIDQENSPDFMLSSSHARGVKAYSNKATDPRLRANRLRQGYEQPKRKAEDQIVDGDKQAGKKRHDAADPEACLFGHDPGVVTPTSLSNVLDEAAITSHNKRPSMQTLTRAGSRPTRATRRMTRSAEINARFSQELRGR